MKLTPEQIKRLFFHRSDVFAEQQKSGAYFPTKRPITIKDIEEHLKGDRTIGAYCLKQDNTVKWICVDLDGKELDLLNAESSLIYKHLNPKIFPLKIREFSGKKGYHVWGFFKTPVQAGYARVIVKAVLNKFGLLKYEVFPKQTELNEHRKFGNLVKIPLAKHKLGKKSKIIEMEGDLNGV